VNYNVF